MVYSTCSSQVGPGQAGRRFKGTVALCNAAVELLQWPGLGTTAFDTRRDHIRRRWWMAGETHTTDVRGTADRTQHRGDERRGHTSNRWWWIGGELLSRDSCLSVWTHALHHLTIYIILFYVIFLNVQNRGGVSWLGHSFAPPSLCLFMFHREQTDWNWRRRSDGGAEYKHH